MTIRDQRNYDKEHQGAILQKLVEALVPLKVDVTSTGNGADQTEDTLRSYSLPANTLGANYAQGVEIEAWGTFGASNDNKRVKLYFGTTVFDSGVLTDNAKNWRFWARIFRTGVNTQVVVCEFQHDTASLNPTVTTATETETAAIVIKTTGQNSSNSTANSVINKLLLVTQIEAKQVT